MSDEITMKEFRNVATVTWLFAPTEDVSLQNVKSTLIDVLNERLAVQTNVAYRLAHNVLTTAGMNPVTEEFLMPLLAMLVEDDPILQGCCDMLPPEQRMQIELRAAAGFLSYSMSKNRSV